MSSPSTIIGIDLGGTKTAIALFEKDTMKQLSVKVFPTEASRGFSAVKMSLLSEIAERRRDDTVAVGLGVPGFIDHMTGTIVTMPNIPGAEGMELAACIHYETRLPTVIENDARCFAYAEALLGAGKGHDVVLGVTLGTGVGGGIVINQKLFHGAHGYAGEIGHMLLQPGQPPYPTKDKRGEVEQFLSGTAMGKRCEAAESPEDYLEGQVCGFMQPQVFREVAWLVVNAVHTIDPSVIVFGGSAGRALKPHFKHVEKELEQWMLPGIKAPLLAASEIKDAAVMGAALLAGRIS
ncbi:MAG: ROK family protein [Candidatus Peribacteraceae bacterium]|nr:ROK family protein [Candidatus Peribacteraceae bacterium]MBP9850269.1 ROK family protein [Candidatus Peribacteraceae bacterium]